MYVLIACGMLLAGCAAEQADRTGNVKDLVCGMEVDPQSPGTYKTEVKGETYYFCSEICKKSFEANPEEYIRKAAAAGEADAKRQMDVK